MFKRTLVYFIVLQLIVTSAVFNILTLKDEYGGGIRHPGPPRLDSCVARI